MNDDRQTQPGESLGDDELVDLLTRAFQIIRAMVPSTSSQAALPKTGQTTIMASETPDGIDPFPLPEGADCADSRLAAVGPRQVGRQPSVLLPSYLSRAPRSFVMTCGWTGPSRRTGMLRERCGRPKRAGHGARGRRNRGSTSRAEGALRGDQV